MSLIWFILGSTASFQRSLDIVGSVTLTFVGIPSLVLTLVSIRMLLKRWVPTSGIAYASFIVGIVLLIFLSVVLIKSVDTRGWITEKVTSDSLKFTADEKYEYRIDIINVFQKNSRAQLHVRNVATGEISRIPISMQTEKIVTLRIEKVNNWVFMEPTEISEKYILHTTSDLGVPKKKFEIDIAEETAKEIKTN